MRGGGNISPPPHPQKNKNFGQNVAKFETESILNYSETRIYDQNLIVCNFSFIAFIGANHGCASWEPHTHTPPPNPPLPQLSPHKNRGEYYFHCFSRDEKYIFNSFCRKILHIVFELKKIHQKKFLFCYQGIH